MFCTHTFQSVYFKYVLPTRPFVYLACTFCRYVLHLVCIVCMFCTHAFQSVYFKYVLPTRPFVYLACTFCRYVLHLTVLYVCLVVLSIYLVCMSCLHQFCVLYVRFVSMSCRSRINCLVCMSCSTINPSCMYVLPTSICIFFMYVLQVCIANLIIDCLVCMSCSTINLSCMYVLPTSILYIFYVCFAGTYCTSEIDYCDQK